MIMITVIFIAMHLIVVLKKWLTLFSLLKPKGHNISSSGGPDEFSGPPLPSLMILPYHLERHMSGSDTV